MFLERSRAGELDVRQSHTRGQSLLEIAKMRSLNEIDLKTMLSKRKVSVQLILYCS
jgi:hypothetical protein